ncbi:glycosyltransferase [Maribacter sp. ACAM166]|uniref:glycosyltransferase n=1 Tax=Maribacter sp. ACAM166 TaxID=2508996 RepID=UPI0010FE6FA2|nr:glycosyltransferase [Maribacter sp. ACAM166]TLP70636.1 glycosyltransferase [Maribacter sp. ACAM166]
MINKIKIIFVLPSLRAGGAERVMSFIALNLDKNLFDASLLITGSKQDQAYTIHEDTPITFLNKNRVKNALPAIALNILRHKPHIVIGAIGHINFALAILAIFFRNIIFIGRETYVLGYKLHSVKSKAKKIKIPDLRPLTLDKIICQSDDMKNDLVKNFKYPAQKIVTINNPVTNKFKLKAAQGRQTLIHFITVGRLSKQKGHIRLLDVLAQLNTPFQYTLIGDGPEKEIIFEHAEKLNLNKYITHVPFTTKVEDYLAKSDLFLCGSYVEGFPNALIESCAVGTPILAFNAPGGLNEIVEEGINGYLANDETDFLLKLRKSITTKWDAKAIRQSVLRKYQEELILNKYETLFLSLHEGPSTKKNNN